MVWLDGMEGGEYEVAALVRPFSRPDGDGCDVSVWIEADGRGNLEGFSGEPIETELYVYALDAEGEVRDTLTRRIQLDPARVEARLAKGGNLKFYGDVHLAPGDYGVLWLRTRLLRVSLATGAIGRGLLHLGHSTVR